MRLLLEGSVRATGKDHENFGSDEFLRDNHRGVHMVIDSRDDVAPIPIAPFKWGGECRIEVHLNAISNEAGTMNVYGHTSFFEGSSENTHEEREREILNFLVPKASLGFPHPTVVAVNMNSGPDNGQVVVSLTNTVIEEE